MNNRRSWTAALCLGVMTFLAGSPSQAADPVRQKVDEVKAKMKAEGWKEISDNVYERQLGPNKVEHLGYGRDGLAWTVGEMNRKIASLRQEYKSYPSEKLAQIIADLTIESARTRRALFNLDRSTPEGISSMVAAVTGPSCSSICYGATADAYPQTSPQGVGAVADAKFNSTCGYSGDTYAYAYARATLSGTTSTVTQSDPHTGTSVTSYAAAAVNGGSITGTPCYSEASAYAQSSALGISYSTSDTNSSCPAPSCSVTISGTTYEYFTGPGCRSRTFTATPSSGCAAPITYSWKIGSTVVGTASTYTKSICPSTASFTLTVGATPNGGTTVFDDHFVDVFYEPCECCGGGICP
jgi:hypothetical protein